MERATHAILARAALVPAVLLFNACGWVDDGVDGNEPPTASDADYEVVVGERLEVPAEDGVLKNASDPGGRTLTAKEVSRPEHAAEFELFPDGSFVYVHDDGQSTADSFEYAGNDGIDDSEPTRVTIHIHQYPTVTDHRYEVVPGRTLEIKAPGVLQGAEDLNGDPLTAHVAGEAPQRGEVTLNSNGSFTYQASTSLLDGGEDSFQFYADDGTLASAPGTVTIKLTALAKPNAGDDNYSIDAGGTLDIAPPGVLGNDSSPREEELTAQLTRAPAHAAAPLELGTDGGFVYQHDGSDAIEDEFTYRAVDLIASDPATVTISINQPPVAQDDVYETAPGVELQVGTDQGVLANDSDPNPGDAAILRARVQDQPAQGDLSLAEDGSFTYRPTPDARGEDSFTYRAADESLSSEPARVTISFALEDPVAEEDQYEVDEGQTLTEAAPGVLENDSAPPGVKLRAELVSGPSFASDFELGEDGALTYVPDDSAETEDRFTYVAYYEDGGERYESGAAPVIISIVRANEPPLAQNQCTDTGHGERLTLSLRASDRETPTESLLFEVPSRSDRGALTLVDDGWSDTRAVYEAVYESTVGAAWGRDRINYSVTDEHGASDSADVHVVIRPRIMPLGDSITTGKHDGRENSETAGYRERLWAQLDAEGYRVDFVGSQSSGTSAMDPDHEGHNGIRTQYWGDAYDQTNDYTEGIREQIYGWLDDNPADAIILHIGTNDINTGIPPTQADEAIGEILASIENWATSNSPVELLLARIIDFQSSEPKIDQLNSLLAARVDDRHLVDQYSALRSGGEPDASLYADRLHPNRAGYERMADVWHAKLEPLLSEARCPEAL